MIEGPWSEPKIYPDMAGILDNPDAAYAKLHEMGKGLFGANGGGLGDLLGGLGGLTGGKSGTGAATGDTGTAGGGALGGNLGQALGGLIQQGIANRPRSIPTTPTQGNSALGTPQVAAPAPAQPVPGDASQDSQPMNDVLKQLFNRSAN
jgi:AsmA protein